MRPRHTPLTGWNDLDALETSDQTRLETDQDLARQRQEEQKELNEKLSLGGSLGTVRTSGVMVGPGLGVIVVQSGVRKSQIEPDGDVFFGSDIDQPAGTSWAVFVNAQIYNTEEMDAGDILIGDNSADTSNVKWDESEGQLQFRFGQTVNVYMDTDGSLRAGGGNVLLNDEGIVIIGEETNDSYIIFRSSGGTNLGQIYTNVNSNLGIVAFGQLVNRKLLLQSVNNTSGGFANIEITAGAANATSDSITVNADSVSLNADNHSVSLNAEEYVYISPLLGTIINTFQEDSDFWVYGADGLVLKVDAGNMEVGIGAGAADILLPTASSPNPNVRFNERGQDMDFSIEDAAGAVAFKVDAGAHLVSIYNVTSTELEELTDGSETTLHTHAGGGGVPFLPFGVYTNISPLTAAGNPYSATIDRSTTFVKWSQSVYVETTNNGTNYWKVEMYRGSDNSLIKSLNTSAIGANTIATLTATTFSISSVDATGKVIYIYCEKVGAPGPLYIYGPLLEVTV